jgi:hypothetical protein
VTFLGLAGAVIWTGIVPSAAWGEEEEEDRRGRSIALKLDRICDVFRELPTCTLVGSMATFMCLEVLHSIWAKCVWE